MIGNFGNPPYQIVANGGSTPANYTNWNGSNTGGGSLCGGCLAGPIYLAAAGSDANACTISQPCQTVAHLNGLTLQSGASIFLNKGDTFGGGIIIKTGPVTIDAYGSGAAPVISSGNSAPCVSAYDVPSVTVQNITCTGGGNTTNTTNGIEVENDQGGNTKLAGPTINNVTMTGYGGNGIVVYGATGASGYNNTTITNNVVHDTTGNQIDRAACIDVLAFPANYGNGTTNPSFNNVTITGNLVYNCTGKEGGQGPGGGHWNGVGIVVAQASTILLSKNVAHDIGATSSSGTVGIWCYDANACTISFNEVYNQFNGSAGFGTSTAYDLDGGVTNSVMEYNYSYANQIGYFLFPYNDGVLTTQWTNNYARYNISQFDLVGLSVGSQNQTAENCAMYNNTVIGAQLYAFSVDFGDPSFSGNCVIANNLFNTYIGASFQIYDLGQHSSLVLDGNTYSGNVNVWSWGGTTYSTFATWKAGSGQDAHAVNAANPGIINLGLGDQTCYVSGIPAGPAPCPYGNQLLASSALVSAGIDLTQAPYSLNVGTIDYYGNTIPHSGHYNIGADGSAGQSGTGGTAALDPSNLGTEAFLAYGNLTVQTAGNSGSGYSLARSVTSHSSGKFYFEVTNIGTPGTGDAAVVIGNGSEPLQGNTPGFDANLSVACFGNPAGVGGWYINSANNSNCITFAPLGHEIHGVAVDFTAHLVWIENITTAPGVWNAGGTANPATGVGGQSISAITCPCYAAGAAFIGASSSWFNFNFGQAPYQSSVPSGFGNW